MILYLKADSLSAPEVISFLHFAPATGLSLLKFHSEERTDFSGLRLRGVTLLNALITALR